LRDNLCAAADQVGTRQAVRQLGDLRRLAAEYLAAEYGELARRPSWTAAAVFIVLFEIFLMVVGYVATSAFQAAVTATTPHATGTFHWHGISYLISPETFIYRNGHVASSGGAWTPLVYVLMLLGTLIAGRIWRLLPVRSERRILNPDGGGAV
jgi:predicted acyltransferase